MLAEYKGSAEGKFTITNNTLQPMAVILEPKSFDITPDGRGVYRTLDSGTHVELSATSVRLAPKQTYYVFYKAKSDRLPAWFTVYSVFSPLQHGPGLDVRMLLPHTVYLNQKEPLKEADVHITRAVYGKESRKIFLDLENTGVDLGRVAEVHVGNGHDTALVPGFPLLPGNHRHVEVQWDHVDPPNSLVVKFDHFTLTPPLKVSEE